MDDDRLRRFTAQELKQLVSNAQRLGASGTAAQRKAATAMIARLEALPEATKIEIAFRDERLTATDRKLIEVLDRNAGATGAELTAAMGWRSQSWQLRFGTICRDRLAPLISTPAPENAADGDGRTTDSFAALLADHDQATSGFTLKQEARAALVAAGVLSAS